MRRFSNIDNEFVFKYKLILNEAFVLEWMLSLPNWANHKIVSNKLLYFASRTKAIEDLPFLTDKSDTMYRYYKNLEKKGMIENHKINNCDYVSFLPLVTNWNKIQVSEKNPMFFGFESENQSEINPTYSNINNNTESNIIDVQTNLFGIESEKSSLFKNSVVFDLSIFKNKLDELEKIGVDIEYYYNSIKDWNEIKKVKRTPKGWIATARTWMRKDKEKNNLKMLNGSNESDNSIDLMKQYLNM